ncbi:TPA: hypothetical protein QDB10_003242 [Burkholderia vietnamiensis]|nr:hypothetical protein [Burkholderia vietnamiensis]
MKITDDMLTEWFPEGAKPARPGCYQVTDPEGHQFHKASIGYQYWNGFYWEGLTWQAGRDAGRSIYQYHAWRGLNKEPQRD